ncbi:MAG TPA: DUF1501 domain-containing protein [Nocardioides sp.]|uniref:DUF1501 domain-containing protein n=1 Tax=Nocardioides sp. TaxID=35761 RepID=UPI002C7BD812|nr:DUF1501 domain-containing protein [Nocardioides sp.]HQR28400.1 DUF1501 domain-containing protein [Nocardioides sp.]
MTTTGDPADRARPCGCPGPSLSRRRFLAGVAGATGAMTAASLFGDTFRQVAYGAAPGGNVVVVLSMRGGSDGLSILVPRGADHDYLSTMRPGIVVPEGALLGADSRFGLHPSLAPLLPMWDAGTFGAVHGVGLPAPNRSHFDAMEEVERAHPGSSARVGWINRVVGLAPDARPEEQVQLGDSMLPTALAGPAPALGANEVTGFRLPTLDWLESDAQVSASLSAAWAGGRTPLSAAVDTALSAVDRLSVVSSTTDEQMSAAKATYPDGPLQSVLANTALLIKADIGARVVTIDYGDWDMHTGLGSTSLAADEWMVSHLDHFAGSLARFFEDLGPHAARVTVVTLSEFGRRVEENGDHGVDHGYGNAMLLLGAGVDGGAVRGRWQPLSDASLNEGDVPLSQDYRSVLAEVMVSRFGLSGGQLDTVFPGFAPEAVGAMH